MHGMFRDVAIALSLLSSLGSPAKVRAVDFAAPRTYVVGTNPSNAVVGDFNGDGKPEIALGNSGSDNVSVLLENGDGTFRASVNSPAGSSPAKLAVGDFNGDGKLDLIVVNSTIGSPGAANLLLGNGDGTFHSPVPITAGPSPASVVVGISTMTGSSIKVEVKKKNFSCGWNFCCFAAHLMERDLFWPAAP